MVSFFHRKPSMTLQVDNPYWMSFSDMMSGMLIIFILVSMALLYRISNMKVEAINVRNDMLKEIQYELSKNGVMVRIEDNGTVIRIPTDTLSFDSNSDVIKNKETAVEIGRVIKEALKKKNRLEHLETVFVEGHTDSIPTSDYYGGNWGLSAQRAISLWTVWIEDPELKELNELKNSDNYHLFSVSGYADTRRAKQKEESDEDRSKNRRIDIRFTIRQPSLEDGENTFKKRATATP